MERHPDWRPSTPARPSEGNPSFKILFTLYLPWILTPDSAMTEGELVSLCPATYSVTETGFWRFDFPAHQGQDKGKTDTLASASVPQKAFKSSASCGRLPAPIRCSSFLARMHLLTFQPQRRNPTQMVAPDVGTGFGSLFELDMLMSWSLARTVDFRWGLLRSSSLWSPRVPWSSCSGSIPIRTKLTGCL